MVETAGGSFVSIILLLNEGHDHVLYNSPLALREEKTCVLTVGQARGRFGLGSANWNFGKPSAAKRSVGSRPCLLAVSDLRSRSSIAIFLRLLPLNSPSTLL